MNPTSEKPQTSQNCNRPFCNQHQPLPEERIKEIVTETLIELNLIPKPHKLKAIPNV